MVKQEFQISQNGDSIQIQFYWMKHSLFAMEKMFILKNCVNPGLYMH